MGINAQTEPVKAILPLPMFAPGTPVLVYSDDIQLNGSVKAIKQNKKQQIAVTIPQNGGMVITQ